MQSSKNGVPLANQGLSLGLKASQPQATISNIGGTESVLRAYDDELLDGNGYKLVRTYQDQGFNTNTFRVLTTVALLGSMNVVGGPEKKATELAVKAELKLKGYVKKIVELSRSKYPETTKHIEDAIKKGKPDILTVGEKGSATQRRREAMVGHNTETGKDRDEYPPAMFNEGGGGASVRKINPSDNRGAGACMGGQCRDLSPGDKIQIKIIE